MKKEQLHRVSSEVKRVQVESKLEMLDNQNGTIIPRIQGHLRNQVRNGDGPYPLVRG